LVVNPPPAKRLSSITNTLNLSASKLLFVMTFHDRRTGPNAQAKLPLLFNDAQRQAVEGMKPFLACRRAICLPPSPVTPVKRAYEIALPNEKRPISGALVEAGVAM
nr:hypothetical protein [Escherichia coli]